MSETPVERRRRIWPWIVVAVVLLVLVGAGAFTLGTMTAPSQGPLAVASTSASQAPTQPSVAPTPILTPTPTPSPNAATVPAGPKLTADEVEFYHSAISSGNTAVLVTTEAPSTRVKIAGQNCCGLLGRDAATNKLSYVTASDPKWSYSISSADRAKWRAGPYAKYFPVNAIVGQSNDGSTFSFSFNAKKELVAIFMAKGAF